MRSRFPSFARVLLLALAVVAVPACKSNKALVAPVLMTSIPMHLDSNVPIIPNIIFKFDRAMDPAFMTQTYTAFFEHNTSVSVGFSVEFLPALDELRILPTSLLTLNKSYDVFVSGQVQSAAGTPMGSNQGITFTTQTTTTTVSQMTFLVPTAGPGTNPGEVVLGWNPGATESPGPVTVPNYDIYVSTVSGGEDLMIAPPVTLQSYTSNSTSGVTLTLTPATQYWFKIQPRDSSGSILEIVGEIGPVTTP